jgi:hypothetical protein
MCFAKVRRNELSDKGFLCPRYLLRKISCFAIQKNQTFASRHDPDGLITRR